MRFDNIKLLVIDVDGTLTDSGIYYDNLGNETKKFSTKDAAGFFAAHAAGIKTMVLTGRESAATQKRMGELKVDFLNQGVRNKKDFLEEFMKNNNLNSSNVGYIGDDVNDLAPMKLCGFVACPQDGCKEIKDIANYICETKGGYGAVREVIEYLLRSDNRWDQIINNLYCGGI